MCSKKILSSPNSINFRNASSSSSLQPFHTTATPSSMLPSFGRMIPPIANTNRRLIHASTRLSLTPSSSPPSAAAAAAATTTTTTGETSTPSNKRLIYLLSATAAATAAAATAAYTIQPTTTTNLQNNDMISTWIGLQRSLSFYSLAIPKYIEYRYHMMMQSDDDTWDELDRRTSLIGLKKILELRGFYIKSGQLCSNNIGNAFPKIWQETMSVLQDEVPPKDFSVVRKVIEDEFGGRDLYDVFGSFDEDCIGAASIGQVHRATLHDGTRVVVKVMYPEVESLFRNDVRTIKAFCKVAQPVHVPPLEEIEVQFMTEFDYIEESKQLNQVRLNLQRGGLLLSSDNNKNNKNGLCQVPKPYLDLCTKRVLVMEELKGEKLAVALKKDEILWKKILSDLGTYFNLEQPTDHQPKKGPSSEQYNRFIQLYKKKRQWSNFMTFLHNSTLAFLPGISSRSYTETQQTPLNHAQLVDDLIYIHGHEVLVDGYFNGDPHPGNILLCPSSSSSGGPKLGLIDYGQVKQLDKEKRLLMCKIILALADDDKEEIVRLMKVAGYKSKKMDPNVIYKYAKVSFDEDNKELTNGKHIQLFMEDLQNCDPIENVPTDFIMVGRTSVMLRGLAHALRQSRSVAKAWKPIAEKVLREERVK